MPLPAQVKGQVTTERVSGVKTVKDAERIIVKSLFLCAFAKLNTSVHLI